MKVRLTFKSVDGKTIYKEYTFSTVTAMFSFIHVYGKIEIPINAK